MCTFFFSVIQLLMISSTAQLFVCWTWLASLKDKCRCGVIRKGISIPRGWVLRPQNYVCICVIWGYYFQITNIKSCFLVVSRLLMLWLRAVRMYVELSDVVCVVRAVCLSSRYALRISWEHVLTCVIFLSSLCLSFLHLCPSWIHA